MPFSFSCWHLLTLKRPVRMPIHSFNLILFIHWLAMYWGPSMLQYIREPAYLSLHILSSNISTSYDCFQGLISSESFTLWRKRSTQITKVGMKPLDTEDWITGTSYRLESGCRHKCRHLPLALRTPCSMWSGIASETKAGPSKGQDLWQTALRAVLAIQHPPLRSLELPTLCIAQCLIVQLSFHL